MQSAKKHRSSVKRTLVVRSVAEAVAEAYDELRSLSDELGSTLETMTASPALKATGRFVALTDLREAIDEFSLTRPEVGSPGGLLVTYVVNREKRLTRASRLGNALSALAATVSLLELTGRVFAPEETTALTRGLCRTLDGTKDMTFPGHCG